MNDNKFISIEKRIYKVESNPVNDYFSKRAVDGSYEKLYQDEKLNRENFSYRSRRNHLKEILKTFPRDKDLVLDIGCAGGELAEDFLENGFGYIGCDLSQQMLSKAKEKKLKVIHCDVNEIPIKRNKISFINCLGVLEYTNEQIAVLKEVHQSLMDEGILIFSISTRFCFENWIKALLFLPRKVLAFFYFLVSEKKPYQIKHYFLSCFEMKRLLKKTGFRVEKKIYYNFNLLCFPFSRLMRNQSTQISKKFELYANRFPWRFFTTAVLVMCKKVNT